MDVEKYFIEKVSNILKYTLVLSYLLHKYDFVLSIFSLNEVNPTVDSI